MLPNPIDNDEGVSGMARVAIDHPTKTPVYWSDCEFHY